LGFGFWVLGFGFLVSGSGFRVSGFGFWVPGSGFRVSGFGFRISGLHEGAEHELRRADFAQQHPVRDLWKVDIRLPGKGKSNSHGARPVY